MIHSTNFAKIILSDCLSLHSKLDEANNETSNNVLEEVRNLSDTITKLSSELSITKKSNTLLSSRLVTSALQCWANAQYSRRECLNIVGISQEVSGEVLEEKVLNIFDKTGCSISPDHMESCHRINKNVVQLLSRFPDERTVNKSGRSKNICRNWEWRTWIYLGVLNYL